MQKRDVLNSPNLEKLKKKQRQAFRNKILLYLFAIILLFVGLSFLSRWEKINIRGVEISGNNIIESGVVKEVVNKELSGKYLFFLPKTNFIFYPKGGVAETLGREFKIFTNISVKLESKGMLKISVEEREATYTWCGDALPEESEKIDCYFIEKNGYIFDQAPYFSGDVYFKFFGRVEREGETPVGFYFHKDIFEKLVSFKNTMIQIGLKPSSLVVRNDGDIELYLASKVAPPEAPKIIFKIDSDFEKIIENLQTILTTEPLETEFKEKYSSLLYIDLRFGNKVYYKFK